MPERGRWLDLGRLAPLTLHAAYSGVAQAMGDDDAPVLIWARADSPHISLGASQSAVGELDLAACASAGLELVSRPLGGGTVLVDEAQYGVFVVLPRRRLGGRHCAIFTACLPAMAQVLRDFGIPAEPVGATDVWVGGSKLVGSGAATIGRALVFGASFLMDFDATRFASAVRCPSPGFRAWLGEALAAGMTSWSAHAEPPGESALTARVRRRFGRALDCVWEDGIVSEAETWAIEAARAELAEDMVEVLASDGSRRLVANGIKVNHGTYLLEAPGEGGDWLRVLLRDGCIARLACGDSGATAQLQACVGTVPESAVLADRLRKPLGGDAERWAGRIDRLTADVRRMWHE